MDRYVCVVVLVPVRNQFEFDLGLGTGQDGFWKRYLIFVRQMTDRYLNAVVALGRDGNQFKFDLAGKLGLGTGQDRILEKVPLSLSARHHTDRYVNAVVALAPAGNQFEFDLAGKLGLGPG